MLLELDDQQAAVLRDHLATALGDLNMEISHTDNPAFRDTLRERREVLRHVHTALAPTGLPT